MVNLLITATVPVASVLVGAALTYWLNVRTRRRNFVEDLFNEAITAVAIADAAQYYIWSVKRPKVLDEIQHEEVLSSIAKTAIENHARTAGEARAALAKVLQYEPAVRPYYEDATAVIEHPDAVISVLVAGREKHLGQQVRRRTTIATEAKSLARSAPTELEVEPFGAAFMTPVDPSLTVNKLSTGPGWGDADNF